MTDWLFEIAVDAIVVLDIFVVMSEFAVVLRSIAVVAQYDVVRLEFVRSETLQRWLNCG